MPRNRYDAQFVAVVLCSLAGLIGCGGSDGLPRQQVHEPSGLSATASSPTSTGVAESAVPHSLAAPSVGAVADAGKAACGRSEVPVAVTVPDKDGSVVKVHVYYGTDRAVREVPVRGLLSLAAWLRLTVCSACFTLLLAGLVYWRPRRRWLSALMLGGLASTVAAGGTTAWLRAHPGPADAPLKRIFTAERGALELGVCEVNVPAQHEVEELAGASILHLEFEHDPLKNVVLLDAQSQTADEFYADMRSCIDRAERKEALVFIHGYNVTFSDAARRTAQLAYDLQFDGVPAFFSWPSQGSLLGYLVDETNVAWSVPHLKEFLVGVAKQSGARSVHLVAHSMGNRALASALKELSYEMGPDGPKFDDVVLTAPDIDAETFKQDLAPSIVKAAGRVTLYASSNDEALLFSKKVHGYARAGESGAQLVLVPGMDTIDVSAVDTSLLGHSYYGDNYTVLADLYDLLNNGRPPAERQWLRSTQLGQWVYWVFLRDAPRLEGAMSPSAPIRK